MKIIKKIVIAIAVIIGVILISALFVGKEYSVERVIMIQKPITEVYDYIKFLKNQENFSKWHKLDLQMKKL